MCKYLLYSADRDGFRRAILLQVKKRRKREKIRRKLLIQDAQFAKDNKRLAEMRSREGFKDRGLR